MKCPKCRAAIDDGLERCTFCGHYFQSSMMEEYKLDNYDPTAGYNPSTPPPPPLEKRKSKFKLFGK
jgi:hypothetical protein